MSSRFENIFGTPLAQGGSGYYTRAAMRKKELSEEARRYFIEQGRKGGKKSAKARMAKISPEERSEIASNAAKARWKKQQSE